MYSPDHSTKGTPSALPCARAHERPLAAGKDAVSGSLSSPLRGAFHHSLTVLVRYRSREVLCLGGWSPQLPTRFLVPRGTQEQDPTASSRPLQDSHLVSWVVPDPSGGRRQWYVTLPYNPVRLVGDPRFGLLPVRSPLLRESRLMSSRRATEMVQFTRCPPVGYAFPHRSPGITLEGLPHSDPQGSSLACSSP